MENFGILVMEKAMESHGISNAQKSMNPDLEVWEGG